MKLNFFFLVIQLVTNYSLVAIVDTELSELINFFFLLNTNNVNRVSDAAVFV